jgi:hypothetical protein
MSWVKISAKYGMLGIAENASWHVQGKILDALLSLAA